MEDITFLEDYQYQVQLNKLDQDIMSLERLSMEVGSALLAIHNATVVEQYQHKYGYTEHFKMLIGEEGLFDSAKEVLRNIITWLKKKLLQLASIIFNIVDSIIKVITSMVWQVLHVGKMLNTKSPYDIAKVTMHFKNTYPFIFRLIKLELDARKISTIGEFTSTLNEVLDEKYKKFDEGITECKVETSYPRVEFAEHAQAFEHEINNTYVTMLNTMGKVIDTLQKSLNENDDINRIREKIGDFVKRFPGGEWLLRVVTETKMYKDIQEPSKEGSTAMLRMQVSACVSGATAYSQYFTKCIRKGVSILKELHAAYNAGEVSIHMEFPFDQAMIKRLSDFYGAPLKVTKLIVTNVSPLTWNVATETPGLMGWCYPGNGPGNSFPTELWINVRFMLSWVARFSGAFLNDNRVNKYDAFIGTVVHECKHLWDMQYGEEFDVIRRGDSFFKYRRYKHERRAQEAATKFEITDQDRAWAKKILDQVEAEIKRQKSK